MSLLTSTSLRIATSLLNTTSIDDHRITLDAGYTRKEACSPILFLHSLVWVSLSEASHDCVSSLGLSL